MFPKGLVLINTVLTVRKSAAPNSSYSPFLITNDILRFLWFCTWYCPLHLTSGRLIGRLEDWIDIYAHLHSHQKNFAKFLATLCKPLRQKNSRSKHVFRSIPSWWFIKARFSAHINILHESIDIHHLEALHRHGACSDRVYQFHFIHSSASFCELQQTAFLRAIIYHLEQSAVALQPLCV